MSEETGPSGDEFVRIGIKDNFYQSSAFIPMAFALVTSVHESGETNIGPHALLAPFGITAPHSMLLISRSNSGTAANIRRTGHCALNYIEYDRQGLQGVAHLGSPGQALAAKLKASPYTLMDPPDKWPVGQVRPQIVAESYQVFECSWDRSFDLDGQIGDTSEAAAAHFVLTINRILVKERFADGIEEGSCFPKMPIFNGFRADGSFWFSEPNEPFPVPLTKVEGQELSAVVYLANRMDEKIRFTDEACEKLTPIPRPFLKDALRGIIEAAREMGIDLVDETALAKIAAQRQ